MLEYWQLTKAVFVFLFAISIGSFLNVVIARLPLRQSIVRPRSRCPKCGMEIKWYDNIPILSFLMLGGKCRRCKTSISLQYPLVELLTGTLALACYYKFGLTISFFVYFAFLAALVAATFIDLPYQIIPNEITYPLIPLGFLASFFTGQLNWFDSLMGGVMGFSIIALIVYGYYFLTKREGMGMGDAKLLAVIGVFLGWQAIPFVLFAGSLQGVVVAVIGILTGLVKKTEPLPDPDEWTDGEPEIVNDPQLPMRKASIAFGPFLSLAAIEFLFFGEWYYRVLLRGIRFF